MGEGLPRLVPSSAGLLSLREEFVSFVAEVGRDPSNLDDSELARNNLPEYLRRLEDRSRGVGLPPGWVAETTYWYVSAEGRLIGMSSLRHRLTPELEDVGGHIGYIVRPCLRRLGHATRLLALTLNEARKLGLERVLLTTDATNVGSRKVIERNGGELVGESFSATAQKVKARYWIVLREEAAV